MMPVTEPPLKARLSAAWRPLYAACAVRTLARTVTHMPMKPARAEPTVPMMNPMAVHLPSSGTSASATTKTTATIATVLYSRARNAYAPSLTASEISFMRAFPASCLFTQNAVTMPYTTPATPHSRANKIVLLIDSLL